MYELRHAKGRERYRRCSTFTCDGWADYHLTSKTPEMVMPGFYPLCHDCAHDARRAELDAYLRDLEATRTPTHPHGQARVIPVRDLGAALEAREAGEDAIDVATGLPFRREESNAWSAAMRARIAAHLARRALGEVSP